MRGRFPSLERRVFLTALIGFIFAIAVPGVPRSQDDTVPGDFSVVFTSSPAFVSPDQQGETLERETLTISADGTAVLPKVIRYSGGFPDYVREILPEETITLAPDALGKIYAAVVAENFFTLDAEYLDPNIIDGDWAELRITANGQTHMVRTRNIKVRAFDRITVTINGLLPERRQLLYNAINGADYEEVER